MNFPEEKKGNVSGGIMLIMLVFLFLCAFSGKHEARTGKVSADYSFAVSTSKESAIPEFQKIITPEKTIRFIKGTDFNPLNVSYRIAADDHLKHHILFSLHKKELLIKPLVFRRIYTRYYSSGSDDFPDLS
jgi:hypothetical protein